jgi:DNA replication protein DnaC
MRNEAMLSLLKALRFNGMLSQFDEIMEAAEIKKLNGIELMQQFFETEIAYRQTRTLRYRLDMARLPQVKSLDNFDCDGMPIQKKQLIALTECQFITEKSNLLLIGGSGSGKTHIA